MPAPIDYFGMGGALPAIFVMAAERALRDFFAKPLEAEASLPNFELLFAVKYRCVARAVGAGLPPLA